MSEGLRMHDGEATAPAEHSATEAATAQSPKPPSPWLQSLLAGYWAWLIGIVAIGLVAAMSWLPFEGVASKAGPPPSSTHELLQTWYRWDTVWYVIIADHGYEYDSRATAFFPLYPMLIRGLNPILPGATLEAALAVSALCCLAALVLVHRFTTEMLGPSHAQRVTYYLLAFPTGFYLFAAYTESLFIALTVASLYFMRRGQWWYAGVCAGFASATRMAGVMLALAFAYEYVRQRGWRGIKLDVAAIALAPAGLGAYMLYCLRVFGDPLHFLESQKSWYRSGFTTPWATVADVVELIGQTTPFYGPTNIRNMVNLTVALGFLALLVLALVGPWRLGSDHAYLVIFAATIILMPLSNPLRTHYPLSSMWRFALECTVAFMVLARMGRNRTFDRGYMTIALALHGAMIVTFVHDQFVA